jgi:uncharacterized damage-inducible protein DinB
VAFLLKVGTRCVMPFSRRTAPIDLHCLSISRYSILFLPKTQGWDTYQELLIKAIEPLSLDQLSLRTAPQLRSIGENAAHIVGTRVGMIHGVLGEGDAAIEPMDLWDSPGAPARSAAELIEGLNATWQMIANALTSFTPADLDDVIEHTTRSGKTRRFTRQWVIWQVIEHDLHHGGEISLILGTHGLTGITI